MFYNGRLFEHIWYKNKMNYLYEEGWYESASRSKPLNTHTNAINQKIGLNCILFS
jgi:hypothetical protein